LRWLAVFTAMWIASSSAIYGS